MKKRVLILIDNLTQYERLKKIVEQYENKALFVFKHSPTKSSIWDHPDFQNQESEIDVNRDLELILKEFDLVFSVHCYQYFPKELVQKKLCINLHPGYNPINRGWYPQVFSIINDLSIGATLHIMDEKLDNGSIIDRELVKSFSWDTSLTIYNRVLIKEIDIFEKHIENILDNKFTSFKPEANFNYFTKKDFQELCEIDMERNGTFMEFYNHLRALSHGDYKNAYFIDKQTGKKIFLKLEITKV